MKNVSATLSFLIFTLFYTASYSILDTGARRRPANEPFDTLLFLPQNAFDFMKCLTFLLSRHIHSQRQFPATPPKLHVNQTHFFLLVRNVPEALSQSTQTKKHFVGSNP